MKCPQDGLWQEAVPEHGAKSFFAISATMKEMNLCKQNLRPTGSTKNVF
jgi:hypothetical protein